jgi:hypothetical protein
MANKREMGIGRITPGQLVDWFSSHHDSWLASTIRQYRAAIRQLVSDEIEFAAFDEDVGVALLKNLCGQIGEDGRQTAPRPAKVSSRPRKRKHLSPRTLDRLRRRLCDFRSPAAAIANKITAIGTEIGPRPCEWDSIEVYDGFCRIKSAKNTNGRANGILRVIAIPNREQNRGLQATVDEINAAIKAGIPWKNMERRVNYLFRRVSHDIGLTRPLSLSTLRHIAIGRWKVSFSPTEVAALAGHASNATAMCHYGQRRSGRKWPPVQVKPYDRCLAYVRDRFCSYDRSQVSPKLI